MILVVITTMVSSLVVTLDDTRVDDTRSNILTMVDDTRSNIR